MYQEFWRRKTTARLKDKRKAEILAPENKPHPYGTKRVSLETGYFEAFNLKNVDVVNIKEDPIESFTKTGIKLRSGDEREFDLVCFATGFDAISGGVTQIDIRGADGSSIKEKWSKGTRTHLCITSRGFPNMFIVRDLSDRPIQSHEFNADCLCRSTDLKLRLHSSLVVTTPKSKADGQERLCLI